MLDTQTFNTVVDNTPLVSIDLCLVFDGHILLGKRTNEPLKGQWFTPGGRIYKNETWQDALLRIIKAELSLCDIAVEDFALMGMWDHFYNNSAFDHDISTHYVNLPHYAEFQSKPNIAVDDQHCEFKWFDLSVVSDNEIFHPYMSNYASCLLKKLSNNYD